MLKKQSKHAILTIIILLFIITLYFRVWLHHINQKSDQTKNRLKDVKIIKFTLLIQFKTEYH
jgi:hypothetical protein